jgi:hypothetical protein
MMPWMEHAPPCTGVRGRVPRRHRAALAALIEDVVWYILGFGPMAGDIRGLEGLFRFFGRPRDLTGGTFTLESTTSSAPTTTLSR